MVGSSSDCVLPEPSDASFEEHLEEENDIPLEACQLATRPRRPTRVYIPPLEIPGEVRDTAWKYSTGHPVTYRPEQN